MKRTTEITMSKEKRIAFEKATDEQLRCAAAVYGFGDDLQLAKLLSKTLLGGADTQRERGYIIKELKLCGCTEIVVRGGFTTAE
jgi:hypothetical protein